MELQEFGELIPTPGHVSESSHHDSYFYSTPQFLICLDENARILDANPAALRKMNLTLAKAREVNWIDLLVPESQVRMRDGIKRVIDEKITLQSIEVQAANFGGPDQFHEVDLVPMDCSQNAHWILAIARDRTERSLREQELRESQALYRTLVEETEEIIFQLDPRGTITYISPAVAQFGVSAHQLCGKNLHDFLGSAGDPAIQAAVSRSLAGSLESFEIPLQNCNQVVRRVNFTLRPIMESDRQVGVRGIVVDLEPAREFANILERRAAQLATLNQIGREITSALDLDEVLQNTVDLLHSSFGYYHVAVYTPDEISGDAIMRSRAGAFASLFPPDHRLRAGQGMVGWVFENKRTLLANDVNSEPSYVNFYPDRIPSRSELTVPIWIRGILAGALDLQSPLLDAFVPDDVHIIETVATQLAVAIANARLYAQAQERLVEKQQAEDLLRIQRDMLAAVGQAANFSVALAGILANLRPTQIFDSGSIYLVEPNGGMRAAAHHGLTPEFAAAVDFLPAEANKTRFVKQGKPGYVRYADLEFDQRIPAGVRQREAMLSLAMVPILRQNEVIACLSLGSHLAKDIPQPVRLVLEAVSEQLGAVISRLKVEHALSNNIARDRALLEALPDFMFIMDRLGRFLAAKPAVDRRFSDPTDTFVGRHVAEILPPDTAGLILEMLRRTLETRQVQEFEHKIFSEPGQAEYFEVRMSAAADDQVVAIVRNITNRRQAELDLAKNNQMYRALFEKNKDGVFILSPQGLYLSVNKQALEMLRCSHEEILGRSYLETVPAPERARIQALFTAQLDGEDLPVYERDYIRPDGSIFRAEVNTALVSDPDGKPLHIQAIIRDISQRHARNEDSSYLSF